MTTPDGFTVKVPDVAQTYLAFRVWQLDRGRMRVVSLRVQVTRLQRRQNPVALQLAGEPKGGWPHDELLVAECDARGPKGIPHKDDSCGIYATTSMDVINTYLSPDAPVVGVVELGGSVIPASQGFRAQVARVAAILLVDPVLTISHATLRQLADAYHVPALRPHSLDPEDYRALVVIGEADKGSYREGDATPFADEVERFLHGPGGEGPTR